MFLTTDEVCDILRISRRTVLRQVEDGEFKASKIRGQYRFPIDQFGEYFDVEEIKRQLREAAAKRSLDEADK